MKNQTVNDLMPAAPDLNAERLAKLKELFPDLFTEAGQLNPDELKQLADPDSTAGRERYEFNWNGKRESKRKAFTPSTATLIYDEARSVNPANANGNLIIEGENLETLKCLLAAYREKIKCIYIDPPYNTGKDFVYSDNYTADRKAYWESTGTEGGVNVDTNADSSGRFHSDWLSMIHPRLLLARQLLRPDGVIFISIDDNEVSNLRKLCDEVFGEDNFFSQVIVRANSRGQTYNEIAKTHEYLLVYTKDEDAELQELEKAGDLDDLNQKDDIGKFNVRELRNRNPKFGKHNRPNLFYPIYINPNDADVDGYYPVSLKQDDRYTVKQEPYNSSGGASCWRWGKEKVIENCKTNTRLSNLVAKKKSDGGFSICEKYRKSTYKPKSIWDNNAFLTESGTVELRKLGLADYFDFPKPPELIKQCISLSCQKNDIVLDFCSGSGTTGHAVMDLNAKDGGNRRFILVQLPEQVDEKSEAFKAGYKKISDITIERNRRVIERMRAEAEKDPGLFDGEFKAPGFKVYRLAKSTFPRVDFTPDPEKREAENVEALKAYIEEKERVLFADYEPSVVFDEVLLKNGFLLSYTLEKQEAFTDNAVYLAADGEQSALICLDESLHDSTIEQLSNHWKFICLERALDTTKKWNLRNQLKELFIAF